MTRWKSVGSSPTASTMGKGKCRICGDTAYMRDEEGWAHPCCVYWIVKEPNKPCMSCASAKAGRRGR